MINSQLNRKSSKKERDHTGEYAHIYIQIHIYVQYQYDQNAEVVWGNLIGSLVLIVKMIMIINSGAIYPFIQSMQSPDISIMSKTGRFAEFC